MGRKKSTQPEERKNLPLNLITAVLTEAGYRCAVPTCRNILALDMHHIWQVNAGGPDTLANLIALCPTCHALYHRGTIKQESVYAWKEMLVAIGRAFDSGAIDLLMFLAVYPRDDLALSGDGVLQFGRLIAAGLVSYKRIRHSSTDQRPIISDIYSGFQILYLVELTLKGAKLVSAWKQGDRQALHDAMSGTVTQPDAPSVSLKNE